MQNMTERKGGVKQVSTDQELQESRVRDSNIVPAELNALERVNESFINGGDYDSIPESLKELNQWVGYILKWDDKKKKYNKLPINPHDNSRGAKANDPTTWGSYERALGIVGKWGTCSIKEDEKWIKVGGKIEGLGLELANGIFGIDLDHVIENGEFTAEALDIIDTMDSYTEYSPSGTGVHILAVGTIPDKDKKNRDVEMYSTGRFFTVTGKVVGNAKGIQERTTQAAAIHSKYLKKNNKAPGKEVKQSLLLMTMTDDELIDRAVNGKNGDRFQKLWAGDWSSYESQSSADMALCSDLAYWTQGDKGRIDTLFRQSGLYRAKWDEMRGADTYGNRTIEHVVSDLIPWEPCIKDEILAYDFSDIGIATRFKDHLKDELKYAIDSKYYYRWQKDQHRWVRYDNELPVSTLAIDFCKDLRLKVKEYVKTSVRDEKELLMWDKVDYKLGKDSTINMISKRYNSFSDVHILSTAFDSEVRYINCRNGVIDTTTGELLNHDSEQFITKYVDVDYIEGSINDLFKDSIEHMFGGDPDEIEAFEILLGYMLSGKANQKTFPIMYGVANSGKSGIFENIIETLGKDYITTMDKKLMMRVWDKSSGANQEIIELQGIRLVVTSETDDDDYLETAWAKKLVGGDTIKGRPLYKPSIEFRPEFVPVIFTNSAPKFNGNDEGIVNRLVIIELLYPLTQEEINPNFREDCQKDREGLFSYIVSCIIKYNKLNHLILPERWQRTKAERTAENNHYFEFKELYIGEQKGCNIDMRDVHDTFELWYEANYSDKVPSRAKITRELKKLVTITQTQGYNYIRDSVMLAVLPPNKKQLAEESKRQLVEKSCNLGNVIDIR